MDANVHKLVAEADFQVRGLKGYLSALKFEACHRANIDKYLVNALALLATAREAALEGYAREATK